jgi:hypothetical protein
MVTKSNLSVDVSPTLSMITSLLDGQLPPGRFPGATVASIDF